ncbi:MAG: cupin domain-containing protein [Reyranella sp.]|nr:cupin domain-containing protein [Reyranella sp.]
MSAQGIVVPPGQRAAATYGPGWSNVVKLQCDETHGSTMVFEANVPVGTKSTLHLHHDSDEVAYVLSGEVTFLIGDDITVGGPGTCAFMPRGVRHAWKSTGAEAGRVLFFYTPASAGGLIEEQQRTGSGFSSMTDDERSEMLRRYGWELLGPSPL